PPPDPSHLHSCPTRRSSDLARDDAEGKTDRKGHDHHDRGLPCHRRRHLPLDESEGLQDGEVPPPPSDRSPESEPERRGGGEGEQDRKSTRLNSSHVKISYAV